MAARKEPTGWVQDIAPPRSSFLRRKVTSEATATGRFHCTAPPHASALSEFDYGRAS